MTSSGVAKGAERMLCVGVGGVELLGHGHKLTDELAPPGCARGDSGKTGLRGPSQGSLKGRKPSVGHSEPLSAGDGITSHQGSWDGRGLPLCGSGLMGRHWSPSSVATQRWMVWGHQAEHRPQTHP